MAARRHVVITGTGRAGTTFLVELLTHLGLDTGFTVEDVATKKFLEARAGLESDIRQEDCPYITKSPHFCDDACEIIGREDIVVEQVFIPVRNLHAAAESRRYVSKMVASNWSFFQKVRNQIRPKSVAGGLWLTASTRARKQEEMLLQQIYKLALTLSKTEIPVTLMHYPSLVKDPRYLYGKLRPILSGIEFDLFQAVFTKVARPELVHCFNGDDR